MTDSNTSCDTKQIMITIGAGAENTSNDGSPSPIVEGFFMPATSVPNGQERGEISWFARRIIPAGRLRLFSSCLYSSFKITEKYQTRSSCQNQPNSQSSRTRSARSIICFLPLPVCFKTANRPTTISFAAPLICRLIWLRILTASLKLIPVFNLRLLFSTTINLTVVAKSARYWCAYF